MMRNKPVFPGPGNQSSTLMVSAIQRHFARRMSFILSQAHLTDKEHDG
jgi:hypothetical protein